VAGIIAAEENGIGVIGVAPEADLYAVKVLDGAGFGLEAWIIAGIEWAVFNGIEIINLSIEGPDAQGLHDACYSAYDAGVLLVAAGGNSLVGEGPVEYPAAYESVMAVTATDAFDMPGYFSPVGEELELAAPGVDVLSTVTGGSYEYLSGTSQAAPHVTGTAALFINTPGLLTNEDVRQKLQMTAIDLGDQGRDSVYGFGLVNAAAASFATDWCEGDFGHDGDVDGSDLAVFSADFGRTDCDQGEICEGDFDCDNDVDGSDLAVVAGNFGRTDCPIE
jgi:subtilisin